MKKQKAKATRTRMTPVMIVMCVILCLYCVSLIVPFVWAFITSFKTNLDFNNNKIGLPNRWMWNYGEVFGKYFVPIKTSRGNDAVGLVGMFGNSILYSTLSSVVATIVPCITAYLCARFKCKFSTIVVNVVIIAMILPIVGSQPSQIAILKALRMYDNIWLLWLMHATPLGGMYFLMFYNFFRAMPPDFIDAAKIDGANNMQILLNVVFPVVKNMLFTIILIKFVQCWNDYQTPLLLMPNAPTAAYGLYWMSETTIVGMATAPMRMAASIIMFVPIFVAYTLLQKRLLGNLMAGGIKG